MKSISEMSRKELAAYICDYLDKCGKEVVLTGGSCVSIYSNERYVTMDLDFVERIDSRRKELAACLSKIGFYEHDRYFMHTETDFFLDFPAGPLAVGEEPMKEIFVMNTDCGQLRIISPTECVKDRLAAFYYWNDRQCLDQALFVVLDYEVDLKEVERWSLKEDQEEKFRVFQQKVKDQTR